MGGSSILDYSIQPYQGTDVIALVLLISAVICLVMRWRDSEPGMGWFALSMARWESGSAPIACTCRPGRNSTRRLGST